MHETKAVVVAAAEAIIITADTMKAINVAINLFGQIFLRDSKSTYKLCSLDQVLLSVNRQQNISSSFQYHNKGHILRGYISIG